MFLKKYHQVVSLLLLVAAVYYSFNSSMPSFQNEAKSTTEFSTENALNHLHEISKKPHYTGSSEHNVVREYLVNEFEKLGLQVEVQEQFAINKKWRGAANTKNIVAKIKGSEKGKALLLLSHYDSSPHSSLGASDAGSGVVTILEGVRAFLEKNETPKNDVIICITDAEELGLLGANAFVNYHPWAKDVGLVLNFEARGSGGPSYMLLETNGGNKKLIEAFQDAKSPFPAANSLMYSIYKMLPNDTDLTVFREDGDIDGFNFAFIGDHFDYHTAQDSYERMDLNTLQHQESYLTALLNYFSNADLENLKAEEDYVFFNFPGLGLVFYPFSWVGIVFWISVLVFLGLLFLGFLKKKLTINGIVKGFIPFILSLLFSSLLSYYGWKLLLKIHPQYNDILQGFTYNGYLYIGMFVAFTVAICFWFYKGFFKQRSSQDLLIAPLFFWILVNGGVVYYLVGAGFFIIPVIVLLLILSMLIFSKKEVKPSLLFTFLAIPVLIIFAPMIKMFPVGLGLKMLVISTVFTVMLFGFLVPVFIQYKSIKKLSSIFFLIGAMLLISASLQASFSEDQKQPNSILYVVDANKNEANWVSYNATSDEFLSQFFNENIEDGSNANPTSSSKYKTGSKLRQKTALRPLEKPIIAIVLDTIVENRRKVCLSITSLRNANYIEVITKTPVDFTSFIVNGEALKRKSINSEYVLSLNKGTLIKYYRTSKDEIMDLEFVVPKNQQFDLNILEIKYDLFTNPNFNIQPRTSEMMPTPFVLNDATVIQTNLKF